MRRAIDDGKLAEIFIQSHKNAGFVIGSRKYLRVAGVFRPITRPRYVVPGLLDILARSSLYTGVEKNFHEPNYTKRGSTRSWPTILRA
jgi:hypothetical protein